MFIKDEVVVCILNHRTSLTVGKEYLVLEVYGNSEVTVKDDDNYAQAYNASRFMSKAEFRSLSITQTLK